jgi:uroporphyrinogen decarboxylase
MNERKRQLEALLFGKPDRIPLTPGGGRKSTRETWRKQGLPDTVKDGDIIEYAYRQAGGKMDWPKGGKGFSVNERMIPQFEEKVIERKENSQIVQDWKGNICEIGNEFTVDYLRNASDFVTRRWIKCPVETRADWEEMKKRYNPNDLQRYSDNPVFLGKELQNRESYVGLHFSGPFWQLREWLGFENLCTMFYDDPDFVMEMILFWQEYVSALLKNAFKYFTPDEVHLSEDMAYKSFSMVSPDMAREFLLPTWIKWGEIIRGAGVPLYAMDSDGFIGELIPLWLEAGINACDPIEVAAGNDIVDFRKRFGKNMAYRGGVDKRAMAKGGRVIEDEIKRIEPVIRDGGFIPSCDHGVPSDVSWDNFVYYVKLLSKATGWM